MKVPGRGRHAVRSRQERLAGGLSVELPGRLRRTSARGWSPWIEGQLALPNRTEGDGPATFTADLPAQMALLSGRAGRTGPVVLRGPTRLSRRPVRFKTEAFYGMDGAVIVLTGDPVNKDSATTTELALPAEQVDLVLERLIALGLSATGAAAHD